MNAEKNRALFNLRRETKHVVWQSCELIFHSETEKAIKERFERFGRPVTPNNLRQAYYPEGAEVIANPNGTAPGIWFFRDGKILVMLPGPPNELQPMFVDSVIPRLAELGFLSAGEAYVQVKTAGIGESALETLLQPIFDRHEHLDVAYCAHAGQVDFRLSSQKGNIKKEDLEAIAVECRDLLEDDFLYHFLLTKMSTNVLCNLHLEYRNAML